ncbi:hypothetical protein LHYA1_G006208 [Lachnellula hyalina]|uniref:Transcription factor RfeG n=1 Tax=Lachnellula hyalina TaxID=1316788 RepID=A0A8H8TX34_9HELO|nr:uncharacterized protein LHYA1_G006208 [Lachnellula hyalina]TVY25584.1 hypothetical protein LHYA1_G006208 [Lachnellula hyalina]
MVSTERSLPPTSVGTLETMLSYGLNPNTRQIQQGYFITAYRNLTTAMIADLKADSDRWEAERRSTQSRGQPSNVEYRASTTHQSRQYYGPTEAATGMSTPGYAPAASSGNVAQQGVYDYPQSGSYAPPVSSGYAAPSTYSQQDNNYYVAGANMGAIQEQQPDPRLGGRVPVSQPGTIPRTGQQYGATPAYAQREANPYYSPQPPATSVSSSQYPSNPSDPYYGRVPPVTGTYDSQDYDGRPYQDNGPYSQAQMTQNTTATSGPSSRPRERERDSDRERRHRHR